MEFSINNTANHVPSKQGEQRSDDRCGQSSGNGGTYSLHDIRVLVDTALQTGDPEFSAKITEQVKNIVLHQYADGAVEEMLNELKPAQKQPVDYFHFIYPGILDENKRRDIHNEIVNVVRAYPVQMICTYLDKMAKDKKILLPDIPDFALTELRRLGMPGEDVEGYSKKSFCKYYKK